MVTGVQTCALPIWASTTTTAPIRPSTTSSSRTARAGSNGCASWARSGPRRCSGRPTRSSSRRGSSRRCTTSSSTATGTSCGATGWPRWSGSRAAPRRSSSSRSAGATSRATPAGRGRWATCPSTRSRGRSRRHGSTSTSRAARTRASTPPRPAGRSSWRRRGPRSSRTRTRESSAGSSRAASCSSCTTPTRRSPRTATCSVTSRRLRPWGHGHASGSSTSTRTRTALSSSCTSSGWVVRQRAVPERRGIAIVPAFGEEGAIAGVVAEIKAFDPGLDVVVIDDGSPDGTAAAARAAGAAVVSLPFNLGIGGAVQTGFKYALVHGYELAVRLDGDGQHDPTELPKLIAPVLAGEADIVVGSRFADEDTAYRAPLARRLGIGFFARIVSLLVRQRVTDTTSGFQALNHKGIALFAADYPHDYPEVEATVMVVRHELRLLEVSVRMREREHGRSSITALRSLYYVVKVLLALFVGLFRRRVLPLEDM